MNRRSFFKSLGMGLFAVAVVPALVTKRWNEESELQARLEKMQHRVGYTGRTYYETGIIYCPYIPLIVGQGGVTMEDFSYTTKIPTKYPSKFVSYYNGAQG